MPMTLSSAELQSPRPPEDGSHKAPETAQQQGSPVAFQQALTAQTERGRLEHQPALKGGARGEKKRDLSQAQGQIQTQAQGPVAATVQAAPETPVAAIVPWFAVPVPEDAVAQAPAATRITAAGKTAAVPDKHASTKAPPPGTASADDQLVSDASAPSPTLHNAKQESQAGHGERAVSPPLAEPVHDAVQAISSAVNTPAVQSTAPANLHLSGNHSGQSSLQPAQAAEPHSGGQPLPQPAESHAVVSAAGTLEIGMGMGSHGWLRVRASLESDGSIATQLVTTSAASAERLQKDLPTLAAYLADQQIAVSSTVVHAIEHAAPAQSLFAGESFGQSGGAGMQQGQQGQPGSQAQTPPAHDVATAAFERLDYSDTTLEGFQQGQALLPFRPAAAGGWLSVRV